MQCIQCGANLRHTTRVCIQCGTAVSSPDQAIGSSATPPAAQLVSKAPDRAPTSQTQTQDDKSKDESKGVNTGALPLIEPDTNPNFQSVIGAHAHQPASPSDQSQHNKRSLSEIVGLSGLIVVITLFCVFFVSVKDKEPPILSSKNQTIASPAVKKSAGPKALAAPGRPDSADRKPIDDTILIADVVAPSEAVALLTAMVANSSSSFRLIELKNQLESFTKPSLGDRKSARRLNEEALGLFRSDNFTEAASLFHQGLMADPSDIEVKNNYVFALLKSGNLGMAETVAGELLMNNPGRSSAWANLAEIYALAGKEEEAARALVIVFQFSSNKDKTLTFLRANIANDASSLKVVAAKAIAMIERI